MNTKWIAASLLSVLPLSILAQQAPPAAGSISGIVVRAGNGEPLAGAEAILTPVPSPSAPAVPAPVITGTSNDPVPASSIATISATPGTHKISPVFTGPDGRFVFPNLEPGLYSLEVLRNEYARQNYGQRILGGPATGIRVSPGQALPDIVMALVQAGNVSGVIRSREGQPQAGVPIQLLRAVFNSSGDRKFQIEGAVRSNDRGEYRLYWVTPGRYYLDTGTPPGPNRPMNPNGTAASLNEVADQSYSLTYFPGVADANTAAAIDVPSGADINGMDFAAARQQLHRVRGHIVDSRSGRPPSSVSVSLAYQTLTGVSGAFNAGAKYDASTGEFELRNVPPGSYVVQAIASDTPAISAGEAMVHISALALQPNARLPIVVPDADVDGVTLQLNAGVSLPGRITVDGTALSQMPGWERLQVSLKPTVDSGFSPNLEPAQPVVQRPKADGTFSIDGVSPGDFIVGPVTGLQSGYYVKEAKFNQTDVLGKPLRFYASESGSIEIVISSKAGSLSGMAVDKQMRSAPGAQMVLVPERQRERTDLYRTAASDMNGRFLFRGIPPGDYRVFGWEALESYAYFDPGLLRSVESQGMPVHVSEAEGSVTVNIIPASR